MELRENPELEAILGRRGLRIQTAAADGHCFFNALMFHPRIQAIFPDAWSLRQEVADELEKSVETWKEFLTLNEGELPDDAAARYIADLRSGANWGGDQELLTVATITGCPIEVYRTDGDGITPSGQYNQDAAGTPIRLLFSGNHYDIILAADDKEDKLAAPKRLKAKVPALPTLPRIDADTEEEAESADEVSESEFSEVDEFSGDEEELADGSKSRTRGIPMAHTPRTFVPQPPKDTDKHKSQRHKTFLKRKNLIFPEAIGSRSHHVYVIYDPDLGKIVYIGTSAHSLKTRQSYRNSSYLRNLPIIPLFLRDINFKSGIELERFLICYAVLHLGMDLHNKYLVAPDNYELKRLLTFPSAEVSAEVKALLDDAVKRYNPNQKFSEESEFIEYHCNTCNEEFEVAGELNDHLKDEHGLTTAKIEALCEGEDGIDGDSKFRHSGGVGMVRVPRTIVPQPSENNNKAKLPHHEAFLQRIKLIFPEATGDRSHHVYVIYDPEKRKIVYIGTTGHSLKSRQNYRSGGSGRHHKYLKGLKILPLFLADINFANGTELEKFLICYAVLRLGKKLLNEDLTRPDKAELNALLDSPSDELDAEVNALFDYATECYEEDVTFAGRNEFIQYWCHDCNQEFSLANTYKEHMKHQHGPGKLAKPFKCDKCTAAFKLKKSLNEHLRDVHGPTQSLTCHKCPGSKFKNAVNLKKHMKEQHGPSISHPCDKCPATFKLKKQLNDHMRKVHGPPQNLTCEKCPGSKFKHEASYKSHMRTYHGAVQSFSCDQCKVTFTIKKNWKDHMMAQHEGRSFTCKKCGKVFKYRNGLTAHMKRPHPEV